ADKGGEALTEESFSVRGVGKALLASSTRLQASQDGSKTGLQHSLFTHYLVSGLNGEAANETGVVTLEKLYRYVHEQVTNDRGDMTPVKWIGDQEGEFELGWLKPKAVLPEGLLEALKSTDKWSQLGAVCQLAEYLQDNDVELANMARQSLQQALQDEGLVVVAHRKIEAVLIVEKPVAEELQVEIFSEKPVGTVFQDSLNDGGKAPKMVMLPAGGFVMGSDRAEKQAFPQHIVTIKKSFLLGEKVVTFDEYDNFSRLTGRDLTEDYGWGRGDRPVVGVTWENCHEYVSWLSAATGKNYRLPSEAEWEYACRAGTTTLYSFGNDVGALGKHAWYLNNSDKKTQVVAAKSPNSWGLYDMHGNVWEWVEDCYHKNYNNAPADSSAWSQSHLGDCKKHVIRGGGWGVFDLKKLESTQRGAAYEKHNFLGFRIAKDL
ncbi:MAG: formylglycine-generating enzyme family protein, partial [Gammaproteobacteria bacterium]|nr:formylglycine-generating enzyme family protein [Gammaproteobacteria bacterium]